MGEGMSGCRSFLAALAMVVLGGILGIVLGIPSGLLGVLGGWIILPWALLLGTFGWGAVSIPYLLVRFFVPALPEAATARAVVGFLLVTPLAAAWAGWYLAMTAKVGTLWLILEPLGYGLVAIPLAIATAIFGRHGMLIFLAGAGEATG